METKIKHIEKHNFKVFNSQKIVYIVVPALLQKTINDES